MRAVAVIVGINDYKDQPLTSAVNDANEVKDALVGLGSLTESDVTLLSVEVGANPQGDPQGAARGVQVWR